MEYQRKGLGTTTRGGGYPREGYPLLDANEGAGWDLAEKLLQKRKEAGWVSEPTRAEGNDDRKHHHHHHYQRQQHQHSNANDAAATAAAAAAAATQETTSSSSTISSQRVNRSPHLSAPNNPNNPLLNLLSPTSWQSLLFGGKNNGNNNHPAASQSKSTEDDAKTTSSDIRSRASDAHDIKKRKRPSLRQAAEQLHRLSAAEALSHRFFEDLPSTEEVARVAKARGARRMV
uniref:Uncharacterized protein n=1 Tax=Lotharella oceanica TaxID=641309 RepID=A0A7S2TU77_9EUKA